MHRVGKDRKHGTPRTHRRAPRVGRDGARDGDDDCCGGGAL